MVRLQQIAANGILYLFCILSLSASARDYQIKHLEPENWWVGMRYHQVQLLLHGDHIADLEPSIQADKVCNSGYSS
jgi:hypothetical protein